MDFFGGQNSCFEFRVSTVTGSYRYSMCHTDIPVRSTEYLQQTKLISQLRINKEFYTSNILDHLFFLFSVQCKRFLLLLLFE